MLYLNPPYHVIDDVSLMPDHADPLQFYFMPLSPHLTMVKDPASGDMIPQILLIQYAGKVTPEQELTGGFLNFDCNLGITPERLEAIASELQQKAKLDAKPKLAPVPLIDGSVRLMLLNAMTPDPAAGPPKPPPQGGAPVEPPGPQFVIKINQAAKPSLYGDNQAAFSVQLDGAGATILRAALQGEMSPIGVVYTLSYTGLRPAYHVHVEADWNRTQTHFEDSFKTNLIVFSSEIDTAIDKLIEDRVIVIEGDLFVAEGDGSAAGEADRYQQAMDEVREMVTQTFFEPSLEPMDSERGDAIDSFSRISQALATGGQGSPFSYRSIDLTRIDQKSLNVDMSERTAVLRTISPQGHLAGLARVIQDEHLDIERFVMRVSLEDPFYQRRRVRVISRAAIAPDHIQSINVALNYEGETKNVLLDATTIEQTLDWQSVLDGDAMRRPVSYRYEVGFAADRGTGRPASIASGELPVIDGDVVEIDPRKDGLYDVMWVPINLVDCPWDVYPTVELDARYQDPGHGIDIQDHYPLTAASAVQGASWPVLVMDPAKRTIEYRLRYEGADGRDVQTDWTATDEGLIRVGDPFPRRRRFDVVVPAGLFGPAGMDRVFVDVWYDDPANAVSKRESFEVSAADTATKSFLVELVDPARREVHFKTTLLFSDGRTVDVPESTTTGERLLVRPDLKGHRAIGVRCEPKDFKAVGLKEVLVEARYEDPAAQLSFADDIRLHSSGEQATFEFDYVDVAHDAYRYRVTQLFDNGLTKATDWVEGDAGEIVVGVQ